MASFTLTFASSNPADPVEIHCDAFAQEGPMLTFFNFGLDRDSIDSWSERVASFRTKDVRSIVSHQSISGALAQVPVLVAC